MIRKTLYLIVSKFLSYLPFFCISFFSNFIGRVAYYIWKKRRVIAINNLKKVYKNMSEKETEYLCKKNFIELSKTFFEIFKQPFFKNKILPNINVIGEKNLKQAFNKNKGVILITAHHGNWEFAGSWVGNNGYPISVVQKSQKNIEFDNLINNFRKLNGMEIIGRKTALKKGVQVLRDKKILTIVADQKAFKGGIKAEFMGIEASTTPLPAKLYKKYKSPIVGMFLHRKGLNNYELEFTKEYLPDYNSNVLDITQNINNMIEYFVRKNPEQWFWGHKRWEVLNYDKK